MVYCKKCGKPIETGKLCFTCKLEKQKKRKRIIENVGNAGKLIFPFLLAVLGPIFSRKKN